MIISESLKIALVNQWIEEKENSHTYLFIAVWLKNFGLDNLGKYFLDASKEEDGHAQSILDLMTDLNVDFSGGGIQNMAFEIQSMYDISDKFLARESQTTQSLQEIKNMCEDSKFGNAIVEEHIRKMIHQQQSEMEESLSFKDKCHIIGDDWKFAFLWDIGLK